VFKDKKNLGFLLAFMATICWSSFYIVSRYAFGEHNDLIDPVFFSFLRFLMASIFFSVILATQKNLGLALRTFKCNMGIFAVLALSGIILEGILIFWSLKYTTASRSSLFANASPIFTVLLAFFVLGENLGLRKIAGMALGFAGAGIAIFSPGNGDIYFTGMALLGDLLALLSGICWAAYTVWGASVAKKYGSFLSTAIPMILGTVITGGIVVLSERPMLWNLSWDLWLAIIYLGIFGNALSFLCWYAALRHLKAGELGAFGYISAGLTAEGKLYPLVFHCDGRCDTGSLPYA